MQAPVYSLAPASIILSITSLVWSSLRILDHNDWALPTRQPALHSDLVSGSMAVSETLQVPQALQPPPVDSELTNQAMPEEGEDSGSPTHQDSSGFAYVFYATADAYACSVLVNIHRLQNLLHVSYPIHVLVSSAVSQEYVDAYRATDVVVHVQKAPPLKDNAGGYYQDCLLKLVAFKLHELDPTLKRVLAFDSDQLVMKNLDHLFAGLPDVDLAAPRAYWLAKDFLASTFLMINLSNRLWHTVESALATVQYNKFDMDLINDLLGETVMMLSGEYVTLNSHWEDWVLPSWYHASEGLNLTTVKLYNQLLKAGLKPGADLSRRQEVDGDQSNPGGAVQSRPSDPNSPAQPAKAYNEAATLSDLFSTRPVMPKNMTVGLSPSDSQGGPPANQSAPQSSISRPRFPVEHPFAQELYRLQDAAAVIHFTAAGKPWMHTPDAVRAIKPDAHLALAEQFALWRDTAVQVCPDGFPGSDT